MRKENLLIPKPKSNFISIQCNECKEKTIIFSHTTTDIFCKSCKKLLVKRSGGKAKILVDVLSVVD
ncbi:MAG TPA: 30S ribosomal protein S27e [Nitrososphaeraceae archaeon]